MNEDTYMEAQEQFAGVGSLLPWILVFELRLSGLVASSFTFWAPSRALALFYKPLCSVKNEHNDVLGI